MVFTPANRAELITGLNAYFTTGSDYGSKRDDGDDISGEGLKDSSNVVITTVGDMGGINDWDVSNVTSFETLFYGTKKSYFNEDISNWNTINVTNFKQVFRGTEFNQNINPKQVTPDDGRDPYTSWNVSKGTDFRSMFYDNEEFDQDISGWQIGGDGVSSVLFNYMFASGSASTATIFNQDISSWDVKKVSNYSNMFMYNTTFNQPNIKRWEVTTTSTGNMFLNANTDMQDIFGVNPDKDEVFNIRGPEITLVGANPLIIDNGVTWSEPGATAADGSTVTITGTIDTNVDGAYTLTYQATDSTGTRTKTRLVMVGVQRFAPANKAQLITGLNEYFGGGNYTSENITDLQRSLKGEINTWDVSSVTSMEYLFYNQGSWSNNKPTYFNEDISGWDVSNVTNFYLMFRNNITFNQPNIERWEVNVSLTNSYMFYDANPDMKTKFGINPDKDVVFNIRGPDITLDGDNPLTIENGVTWSEPGATAADGSSVTVTGTVNTSVDDTYTLTYEATDSTGTRTKTRTVIVDTTWTVSLPTEISVASGGTVDLKSQTTLTKSGVTQTNKSGIVYNKVTNSRDVVFFCKDTYNDSWDGHTIDIGNGVGDFSISIKNRNEQDVDEMTLSSGQKWETFAVTLQDDYVIRISSGSYETEKRIFVVDAADADNYYTTYSPTSTTNNLPENANILFKTRSLNDTFNGKKLEGNDFSPSELGISMAREEIVDGNLQNVTEETTIEAKIDDLSAQATITVSAVADTTAPVITLTGEANVTVNVGGVYNEPGATADTGEPVNVGGDTVNTNVVGTYTVTYNVTDEAGNVATTVERTVTVLPTVQNVSTHTEKNQAKTFSLKYNNL